MLPLYVDVENENTELWLKAVSFLSQFDLSCDITDNGNAVCIAQKSKTKTALLSLWPTLPMQKFDWSHDVS